MGEQEIDAQREQREAAGEHERRRERHPILEGEPAHRSAYPTPRAVAISSALPTSRSLRRKRAMYASSVFSLTIAPSGQAAAVSSRRRTTSPGLAASAASSRNSVGVSASPPSPQPRGGAAGPSRSPRAAGRGAGAGAGGDRRSSAPTRTINSANANGLVR